ncbi:phosphoinositide phosphatase SAC8 isoform X3 [Canna indica]|uniref:Phosphoinositide phosphatase SAC8 isoform X3 n=1 Tax=Canna indica TaxID=4628 RepID=A0AAQ3K653_9LILI|nr:phosphoinositide phosphatase SAC8 isoform X3 [Canna indica]
MAEEGAQPRGHGEGERSSHRPLCCRELRLLEFPDRYVIQSADPDAPDHAFSIGRSDGLVELIVENLSSLTSSKVSTIYGVVGIIRLLAGTYVLLITSRKEVGTYLGFPIFLVTSMRFVSCSEALKHSTPQEKKDEAYFMSLLKIIESTPGLYYSYERDLTVNLQMTSKLTEERMHKPLWKQADPRFIWNRNLMEELIENKLDAFTIPVVQGSFQSVQFTLKDSPARITLISRRCNRRLGTRMWRRGANLEGATANFIETEQIMEFAGYKSSFLQIRGSIPLLWEQIVDLSYKPQLNVINHDETVIERHFLDLTQRYGEIVAVDLTDKEGDEGRLSDLYAAELQNLPYVRYVPFDFHHVCAKGNFDNLQILYDQIKENVESQGYFLINTDGQILLEQNGIIRANCIDCLDRTNVTQSYVARKSLNLQLQKMGAFSASECISMYNDIYEMFKILWAKHGDEISLEYSGTHALKGDLVRYGRQTVGGMIKDGISALTRYYLNNFQDGIRQDALDLISGRYTVSRGGSSPFQLNAFETLSYLPVASALIVGGLTMTTVTLNQAGHSTQHVVSSVFWAGMTAGVMALVKANGKQFCSRPRLCGLM